MPQYPSGKLFQNCRKPFTFFFFIQTGFVVSTDVPQGQLDKPSEVCYYGRPVGTSFRGPTASKEGEARLSNDVAFVKAGKAL